jgi:hypothetical protein
VIDAGIEGAPNVVEIVVLEPPSIRANEFPAELMICPNQLPSMKTLWLWIVISAPSPGDGWPNAAVPGPPKMLNAPRVLTFRATHRHAGDVYIDGEEPGVAIVAEAGRDSGQVVGG